MRYKLMGRSGLRVSELALGTMTFGEEWGWGASEQESRRMGDAHAEANGCTPSQVAIAWVRQQDGVVIPLIGARNLPQLTDNLGALEVRLTDDQLVTLDDVSRVDLGFPHNFLTDPNILDVVSGGSWERLDNHRRGR